MSALRKPVELARADLEIELVEDVGSLRALWIALAAATENIFATWEWFELWMPHFAEESNLRVLVCRDPAGRSVAIVPLYISRRRPTILRFAGYPVASVLGPVAAADDIPRVLGAVRRYLARSRSIFIGDAVPAATADALGGRTILSVPSPILALRYESWDVYLASRSQNFRQELRRKERKLAREHDVRYRFVDDASTLERDFDTLVALHTQVWPQDVSLFTQPKAMAFHRQFARIALEN